MPAGSAEGDGGTVPPGDPFIPAEARPPVVDELAKAAWQVAAALEVWETSER
ncbi:hypothetical protein [Amycolatopsis sp. DG1A-15b]|uniref:hypothetical protein n=1 Tax=Amycolatopsis sp. DG1A-15b TaxID=3052846 RepID=UPI00255B7F86|nr:hypothetical protein [Amycolatopsis sp. DG1A-15b]WIX88791.1 hypothetical protein QRY02_48105 [Amycolatopsis sp. DG1A-15b]